jgi:hypothetical protein
MDVVRKEESLLASLSELRAIEHQRLADERAATLAAMQAKRDQREATARAARDAEAAQLAAERAAQLAAAQAHAAAERQARLQVEAVEAAERARHQAALDERRLGEEIALRREVAQRQRPRWMIAVTSVAVVAALGLTGFAVERQHASSMARQARERAALAQARAEQAAREAEASLDQLARDLRELQGKSDAAMQRMALAQSDADRRAAQDSLREAQRRQAELKAQQRQRDEDRKRKERVDGVRISQDCLNNVICK